jgi:hypothetical protein
MPRYWARFVNGRSDRVFRLDTRINLNDVPASITKDRHNLLTTARRIRYIPSLSISLHCKAALCAGQGRTAL